MLKKDVRTEADAIAYLVDCTLATVSDMAVKKSRKKHEYSRQISIAQTGVNWMRDFGIDQTWTRADEVKGFGWSVAEWAKQFEV